MRKRSHKARCHTHAFHHSDARKNCTSNVPQAARSVDGRRAPEPEPLDSGCCTTRPTRSAVSTTW
eukprot:scaffold151020_cov39-Tisochrysis_lutea.AAC.2